MPAPNSSSKLFPLVSSSLHAANSAVRSAAVSALAKLGEKAATPQLISRLIMSIRDTHWSLRSSVCEALGRLGQKIATSELISALIVSLGDSEWNVRWSACDALGRLGEKTATSEVISGLLVSLEDNEMNVRSSACEALGRLHEKAATSKVISRLVLSLGDSEMNVRWSACEALGRLGEKAATSAAIYLVLMHKYVLFSLFTLFIQGTNVKLILCTTMFIYWYLNHMNRKQSRNFDFIEYFIRVIYFKNLSSNFSYRYIYVYAFDLYHVNLKCSNLKPSADIVTIRERFYTLILQGILIE